jgi:addiction module HigA family antidote
MRTKIMKTNSPQKVPLGPAAVTPGEILQEEFLSPLGITQSELAGRMGIGRMRISQIVRGERAITAETAILLSRALGTTARFWMNLQTTHDLAEAALKMKLAA